ncbi:hypothetical protein [Photorhabdus stackebrandtii]|uniref:hypothetical protein n=1 Tax=Photorhabdus stackebrandtii TaxID=1123042 RepID=UPI001A97FE0B|nr:hypothetical protein [Photorhabdus stackebrandtii]
MFLLLAQDNEGTRTAYRPDGFATSARKRHHPTQLSQARALRDQGGGIRRYYRLLDGPG